jgi:hypothetical protein
MVYTPYATTCNSMYTYMSYISRRGTSLDPGDMLYLDLRPCMQTWYCLYNTVSAGYSRWCTHPIVPCNTPYTECTCTPVHTIHQNRVPVHLQVLICGVPVYLDMGNHSIDCICGLVSVHLHVTVCCKDYIVPVHCPHYMY